MILDEIHLLGADRGPILEVSFLEVKDMQHVLWSISNFIYFNSISGQHNLLSSAFILIPSIHAVLVFQSYLFANCLP